VSATRRLRVAAVVLSAAVIGGALAGCSRTHQPDGTAPGSTSTAPAVTGSSADPSLPTIQDDLNVAQSSTANADGDVAAGDSAAATDDNN